MNEGGQARGPRCRGSRWASRGPVATRWTPPLPPPPPPAPTLRVAGTSPQLAALRHTHDPESARAHAPAP